MPKYLDALTRAIARRQNRNYCGVHWTVKPAPATRVRGVIARMGVLATVLAVVGCGSGGPEAPLNDWSFEVSGVNPDAVAEVQVTGPEGNTQMLALAAGKKVILKDVRAGTYQITLKDVQSGGKTWTPKDALLKLELKPDGTAVNVNNRSVSTGPYAIRLAYKASVLGGAIADPVYPILYGNATLLYQCDATTAGTCNVLDPDAGSTTVNPLFRLIAVGNNRVYTSWDNKIYSCDPNIVDSCIYLNDAGPNHILALIYANNWLYAGLSNGIMWRCDPNLRDRCEDFNNAGSTGFFPNKTANLITSLAYGVDAEGNDWLYAGVTRSYTESIIWKCDPDLANRCARLDTAGGVILALAFGNNRVYAGIDDDQGTLWSCDPVAADRCFALDKSRDPNSSGGPTIQSLIYSNGRLYAGLSEPIRVATGIFWSCDPNTPDSCATIASGLEPAPFLHQSAGARVFISAVQPCDGGQSDQWLTTVYAYDPAIPDSFHAFHTIRSVPDCDPTPLPRHNTGGVYSF